MYGFLLSRRWLAFGLVVVVLAGVCVRMGLWQWGKLDDRQQRNALVRTNLDAEPLPLDDIVGVDEEVDAEREWARVTAAGRYDVAEELTVKFVQRDGAAGVEVLTPLRLDDGTALLVDRGWLATDRSGDRPDDIPPPPAGEVEVSGWLRADSGADETAVLPAAGQVRAVSSDALADELGYPLRDGYVELRDSSPAPTTALAPEPEPDLGQGPHFFYALQWWFFGGLAVVGFAWFARAEGADRRVGRPQAKAISSP